ncbi:MAG: hypothetical protein QOF22_1052 [Bradyrhizobium sp.]|nr:hypothetical protein [Bradyrhizobium sp.]
MGKPTSLFGRCPGIDLCKAGQAAKVAPRGVYFFFGFPLRSRAIAYRLTTAVSAVTDGSVSPAP